jgi:hypothetical protein
VIFLLCGEIFLSQLRLHFFCSSTYIHEVSLLSQRLTALPGRRYRHQK